LLGKRRSLVSVVEQKLQQLRRLCETNRSVVLQERWRRSPFAKRTRRPGPTPLFVSRRAHKRNKAASLKGQQAQGSTSDPEG